MSPELVDSACPVDSDYRVVQDGTNVDWFDLCNHCFEGFDSVDDLDPEWEICTPTKNGNTTLHRTRRDAGRTLSQDQGDYSGYSQPCAVLERMSVDEFEDRIGGGA